MWAKLGYGLIGLLLAACVGLMFLIHWILGTIFFICCLIVCWMVFGVHKKKVDTVIAEVAKETGLNYIPYRLRYAALKGEYKGYETEISYENDPGGTLGTTLMLETDLPGLAALNVKNVTVFKVKHGLDLDREELLDGGSTTIVAKKHDLVLVLPYTSRYKQEIIENLKQLVGEADKFKQR